jgi:hypothetical protein
MQKKFLAVLTAVTLCTGAAACGKTTEAVTPAENNSEMIAAETGTTLSSDKSTQEVPTEPEDRNDMTDSITVFGDSVMKLHDGNILTICSSDLDAEPTDDELKAIVNAALTQYRAAEAQDLDAYIRSFRFADLAGSTAAILWEKSQLPEDCDDSMQMKEAGLDAKHEIVEDMIVNTEELIDESYRKQFQKMSVASNLTSLDDTQTFFRQAYESITADSQTVKDHIDHETLFDTEDAITPLAGIDDHTVYTVYIDHSSRDEKNDLYLYCEILIQTEETLYEMHNVFVWNIDGCCGVCIDTRLLEESVPDEVKGKTAQELFEEIKAGLPNETSDEMNPETECSSQAGTTIPEADAFLGEWDCENTMLFITKNGSHYLGSVTTFEDPTNTDVYDEWEFELQYQDGKMVCNGDARRYHFDLNTPMPCSKWIYLNGSSEFTLTSEGMIWNDLTEHFGDGMVFRYAETQPDF